MWELDYKEGWVLKNWCFWTVVLEKTLESPLDCKEIQPVHPRRDQSWVFIGRTDIETETPILWSPDLKSWLFGKDPAAGKDWGREEKRTMADEMAGWHCRLGGHDFGWTPGVGDGQKSLVCGGSWGHKELDMTEWLNWTELNWKKNLQVDWMLLLKILPILGARLQIWVLHLFGGLEWLCGGNNDVIGMWLVVSLFQQLQTFARYL